MISHRDAWMLSEHQHTIYRSAIHEGAPIHASETDFTVRERIIMGKFDQVAQIF